MSLKNFGAYSEFSSVAFSKHWWGPQGMVIRWYWPFFVVIWWYSPKNVSDVVISEKWGDILISREKIGDIVILPWLWWWYGDIPYRTKFRRIKLTNFGGQWRIFCPQKNFVRRKFCPTKKFVRRIFFFWYSKDTWTAFVKDQGAWVSSLFVAFFLVHFQEWNQSILPRDYRVFKRAVQRASNFPHLHPFTYDKIRCHRSYEQFLLRSDVLRIFFLASIYPLPQPSRYPQWRGSLRGSLRNML